MLFVFLYSEGVNGSTSTSSNMPGRDVESKQSETLSSLVFTPNVIVHISSSSPLSRSDLKVIVTITQSNQKTTTTFIAATFHRNIDHVLTI